MRHLILTIITWIALVTPCFALPLDRDFDEAPLKTERKIERLTKPQRLKYLRPEIVLPVLNIKPGMTIVDIGAGVGLFTFPLSEALQGSGKVYATDIDPAMIEKLKTEVAQRNIENIFPILVEKKGVDAFYTQHSFDIIFMCNVYYHLWRHEDYFKTLLPSLAPNGRLFILQPKAFTTFFGPHNSIYEDEYTQVTIEILRKESDDFPIFQQLSPNVQAFVRSSIIDNSIPDDIRTQLIEDFNQIVSDRSLFPALIDYHYRHGEDADISVIVNNHIDNSRSYQLIHWLYYHLLDEGIWDEPLKKISDLDNERLLVLNKLVLMRIFGLRERVEQPFVQGKRSLISTLEKAGYELVTTYDVLVNHYFFEFKKADKPSHD